jgi:hypothetical protein
MPIEIILVGLAVTVTIIAFWYAKQDRDRWKLP